ncbi:hypothetical protein BSNK01_09680 [Bacillaceae bacterium]
MLGKGIPFRVVMEVRRKTNDGKANRAEWKRMNTKSKQKVTISVKGFSAAAPKRNRMHLLDETERALGQWRVQDDRIP